MHFGYGTYIWLSVSELPLKCAAVVYRDRPHTLNELKTAITVYIRNISQADPQKAFANKIKRVQACIDARGHRFKTSSTFYKCIAIFRTHCSTASSNKCNDRTGHEL